MWCLDAQFSGGLGSVRLMIGLNDLFQLKKDFSKLKDSMILGGFWFLWLWKGLAVSTSSPLLSGLLMAESGGSTILPSGDSCPGPGLSHALWTHLESAQTSEPRNGCSKNNHFHMNVTQSLITFCLWNWKGQMFTLRRNLGHLLLSVRCILLMKVVENKLHWFKIIRKIILKFSPA